MVNICKIRLWFYVAKPNFMRTTEKLYAQGSHSTLKQGMLAIILFKFDFLSPNKLKLQENTTTLAAIVHGYKT
jgi:hypothetical protein